MGFYAIYYLWEGVRALRMAEAALGMLPGALAHVNILAAMLFGAISGSAAASAIGSIMAPHMERQGYEKGYSVAVNVTSATTGLLIPPSNILIVYSLASGGTSIAALFLAGYLPGMLVGVLLMIVAGLPGSEAIRWLADPACVGFGGHFGTLCPVCYY